MDYITTEDMWRVTIVDIFINYLQWLTVFNYSTVFQAEFLNIFVTEAAIGG